MQKILILPVLAAVFLTFGCTQKQKADLLLYNGNIYTVNEDFQVAEAMVVKDGKVLAVGKDDDILSLYEAIETVDLDEKYVYPGFMDPHSHFMGYSMNLMHANLWMSSSMEEIAERLEKQKDAMMGEWLQGRGWDQNLFAAKAMPDNSLLNVAFPDTPVYIVRVDGHAALANDKALQLAGINSQTQVDGGEVVHYNGKPTGLLIDRAMYLVSSVIPEPTAAQRVELLKRGQADMFAVGLTSVCDAGLSKENVLMLDSLHQADELGMRVYAMLNPTQENFDYFLTQGPYQTERLTVRSVKLFADGALGSRGALMKKPYNDAPGTRGLLVDDADLMRRSCELAFQNGFQVNTHCIGDSANSLMLNMYAEFIEPGNDLRWRIEHAQVVDPAEFDVFGTYQIIPSIQAIHAVSDMEWAEDRIGTERIEGAYAFRDLLNQTGWLPNGSDFPVERINPLYSFHAAFTRQDKNGYPKEGWYPQQRLTREEALKGMTLWAAKANFEEDTRGSLEKGKFADFVILEVDLMTIDPNLIYDVAVLETWLGGEKVYALKQ